MEYTADIKEIDDEEREQKRREAREWRDGE